MARQYGNLMQELWAGGARTVAPLKLRVGHDDLFHFNFHKEDLLDNHVGWF